MRGVAEHPGGAGPWELALIGCTKRYRLPDGRPVPVLEDTTVRFPAGRATAVVGRSGTGKTTLLNLLGLLDHPDSGRYLLGPHDVSELDEDARALLRAHAVGFVFQEAVLHEHRTALENVRTGLLFSGLPRARQQERAAEVLETVGLADRADLEVRLLSGGERQRVGIARALVGRPAVVLADEPTGALDPRTGAEIVDLLLGLCRDRATTLVLVTHDVEVASHAETVLALEGGGRLRRVRRRPPLRATGPDGTPTPAPTPRPGPPGGIGAPGPGSADRPATAPVQVADGGRRRPWRGLLAEALSEVRSNLLRTMGGAVSVAVTVAATALVVELVLGATGSVDTELARRFGRPATVEVTLRDEVAGSILSVVDDRLGQLGSPERSTTLAQLGSGTAEAVDGSEPPPADLEGAAVTVVAVDPAAAWVLAAEMLAGHLPGPSPEAAPLVVPAALTSDLAGLVSPGDPAGAVGRTLRLVPSDAVVRVVGVMGDSALERFATAQAVLVASPGGADWYRFGGPVSYRYLTVVPTGAAARAAELIERDLTVTLGLAGVSARINAGRSDAFDTVTSTTAVVGAVLVAVGGISLAVALLGVFNSQLAAVHPRIRTFGLLRTLGATGGDLGVLVLAESVMTAALGGILGVGLAAVVAVGLASASADLPIDGLSALPAVAGLLVSALVGLAAGAVPARIAARSSIAAALRR